jgi:multicomponent Na+:H+ antiporter subunit E
MKRYLWAIVYLGYFFKAFILSNMAMLKFSLFTKNDTLNPALVEIDISDLSNFEILILSHSITLTPGTVTVDIIKEQHKLIVHTIDGQSQAQVAEVIHNDLTRHILKFTRVT